MEGGVAQLVRAPACHAGGCGFEPRRSRQNLKQIQRKKLLFFFPESKKWASRKSSD